MVHAIPKPQHRVGHLGLRRANKPRVHVAPAGRGGQVAILGVACAVDTALVDDVHPSEIGDRLVDHQQLAVIPLVEQLQKLQRAAQGRAEIVKHVHLDARGPQPREHGPGHAEATPTVDHQPHVEAGTGPVDQGGGHGLAGRVAGKDVRLHPHPAAGSFDVGNHGRDERARLLEQRQRLAGDFDALRRARRRGRCAGESVGHGRLLPSSSKFPRATLPAATNVRHQFILRRRGAAGRRRYGKARRPAICARLVRPRPGKKCRKRGAQAAGQGTTNRITAK